MSKNTKLTQSQLNLKVNNLLSGFEGPQPSYPQGIVMNFHCISRLNRTCEYSKQIFQ